MNWSRTSASVSGKIITRPRLLTIDDFALAQGTLGAVRHFVSNRLNLGMLRSKENVVWSFASHDVSMGLGLAGDRLQKRILCIAANFLQSRTNDIVTMHLEFADRLTAEIRYS
jgi:UDP-2-acetamido-3-amino-2,3-dideoxy-glucuronate N-acetyltransferase